MRFILFISLLGWVLPGFAQHHKKDTQKDIVIEVKSNSVDTFKASVYTHWRSYAAQEKIFEQHNKGSWRLVIKNVKEPFYFNLFKHKLNGELTDNIITEYLAEPGDNVVIDIKEIFAEGRRNNIGYEITFSGVGSDKYICKHRLNNDLSLIKRNSVEDSLLLASINSYSDSKHNVAINLLESFRRKMSRSAFQLLKTDYLSLIEIERLRLFNSLIGQLKMDSLQVANFISGYKTRMNKFEESLPLDIKTSSINYPEYALSKLFIGKYKGGGNRKIKDNYVRPQFSYLKYNFSGELRDLLLVHFVLIHAETKFFQDMASDALQSITTDYCYDRLYSAIEFNMIGKPAYNFSLPDISGKMVSLNDFKGKVVLLDFWFYNCPGCVDYFKKVVSKVEDHFQDEPRFAVISINTDTEVQRWKLALESGKYTSLKAVNLNVGAVRKKVLESYNAIGYGFPKPVLIDAAGNTYCTDNQQLRSGGPSVLIALINEALRKIQ